MELAHDGKTSKLLMGGDDFFFFEKVGADCCLAGCGHPPDGASSRREDVKIVNGGGRFFFFEKVGAVWASFRGVIPGSHFQPTPSGLWLCERSEARAQ